MKKIFAFVIAALMALAADDAMGQVAPPQALAPGVLGGQAILAVTATTGRVALPASLTPYGAVVVANTGTKDAFFAFGTSAITATTSSTLIPAGKHLTIWVTSNTITNLAAICGGSDSTTLVIYQASGLIEFGP